MLRFTLVLLQKPFRLNPKLKIYKKLLTNRSIDDRLKL